VPSVDTAWLGPALEIEDLTVTLQVHLNRRLLGARPGDRGTLHLGEAEALVYIETYEPSWRFISDDQSAVDFATRNGLQAIDTPEVLAECYDDGEIGCPQAYDLIIAMREAGRGVRLPPDHWYVCPPLPCP
jgi:predicted nucleic acid-binding protein